MKNVAALPSRILHVEWIGTSWPGMTLKTWGLPKNLMRSHPRRNLKTEPRIHSLVYIPTTNRAGKVKFGLKPDVYRYYLLYYPTYYCPILFIDERCPLAITDLRTGYRLEPRFRISLSEGRLQTPESREWWTTFRWPLTVKPLSNRGRCDTSMIVSTGTYLVMGRSMPV